MRHDHGYIHTPKTKLIPCMECNSMIEVGWKTRTPKRCTFCSETAEAEALRQIAQGFGPVWEKWIMGMARFISQHTGGDKPGNGKIPRL